MVYDPALPAWVECAQKLDSGIELTALERFIYDNEPQSTPADSDWRSQLAAVLYDCQRDQMKADADAVFNTRNIHISIQPGGGGGR